MIAIVRSPTGPIQYENVIPIAKELVTIVINTITNDGSDKEIKNCRASANPIKGMALTSIRLLFFRLQMVQIDTK